MFKSKKISKYIIFEYLKIFLIIYFVLMNLVTIVKFLEFSRKTSSINLPILIKLKIVLFEIPKILEEFIQFIIVISSAVCLKKLSSRSELTILNSFGVSLWEILKIYTFITTIIAFLIIFLFNPLFNKMNIISKLSIFNNITIPKYNEYVDTINENNKKETNKNEKINTNNILLYESNGLWFIWQDIQKNTMIIRSDKVDSNNYIFFDNSIFIFDKSNTFLKRIECDQITLSDNGELLLSNTFIYQKNSKIKKQKSMIIKTNLNKYYVNRELMNRYEDVDQMNIYKVIKIIKDFNKTKLNTVKFKTKLIIFLITPINYFIMNMLACVVIGNNNRTVKNTMEFSIIVVISVIIHIIQNILYALAYANKIDIIFSNLIWLFLNILIYFHILIKKIELKNR